MLERYNPYAAGHVKQAGECIGRIVWQIRKGLDPLLVEAAERDMRQRGYVPVSGLIGDDGAILDGWQFRKEEQNA